MDFLKDIKGKISAKRIAGFILVIAGGSLALALGVSSFFKVAADAGTIQAVSIWMFGTGSAVLGASAIEHIKK